MNLSILVQDAQHASLRPIGVKPVAEPEPAIPANADVVALCDVLAANAAREAGLLARLVAVVLAAPEPQAMADALCEQLKAELTARQYKGIAVRVSELRKVFSAALGHGFQPEPDEGLQAAVARARKAIKGPDAADTLSPMDKAVKTFRKALSEHHPECLQSFNDWLVRKGI